MSTQTAVREATSLCDFEGAIVHTSSFESRTLSTCYSSQGKIFENHISSQTFELSPVKEQNNDLYKRSVKSLQENELALPSLTSSSSENNGNRATSTKFRYISRAIMSICQDRKRVDLKDLNNLQTSSQGTPLIKPSDIDRDISQEVPVKRVKVSREEIVASCIELNKGIKDKQCGILGKKEINQTKDDKGSDKKDSALLLRRRQTNLFIDTKLKPANSEMVMTLLNQVDGPQIKSFLQDSFVSRANYLTINIR